MRGFAAAGTHWIRLLVLGCWLLASAPARASPIDETAAARRWIGQADTLFRRMTSIDMRYALAMTQDAEGFMWLGTQDGVVRWDGYRTKLYHTDPQDVTAPLPGNYVLSLHTDLQGRMWVGAAVGGLARYDPEHDAFVVLGGRAGVLSHSSVSVIADAGKSGLWIGTNDGLHHIDLASNAVVHVPVGADHNGVVKSVLQDADGSLWVGTEKGLMVRRPGNEQFLAVPLDAAGRAAPMIETLLRDSRGNLWIGTRPYGAFVIEPGQSTARPVHDAGDVSHIDGAIVTSIVEAKPGEIWIGTSGDGVVVVDTGAGWSTRHLHYEAAVDTSLQDDDIHAMYRDRSGLLWVASTMAMNINDPRQGGISTLFGAASGARPITAVQVPFVLATPDGRVWLSAGDGGGVDILDPLTGRVGELRPNPAHPRSKLPTGRVLSMAVAPGGEVYIGTRQGLYQADAQGRHLVRVEISQRAADAAVYSLCFDDGLLWMGGTDGLWALRVKPPRAPSVLRHETAERLGGGRVTVILRGAGSTLWVGTATGLNRLDIGSGTVEALSADPTDPAGLLGGYVATLLLDAQDRLWVASIGSGIQVLERHDTNGRPRFRRLGVREGLPHDVIDKLLEDEHGNIWASTDRGLAVIDPSTFAIRALGEAQGVAITEYWSNSGARTSAGELLFGGQGGLTVVRPARTTVTHTFVPVVVTEAHAGGKNVIASSLNGAGTAPRLDVPADDHSLMVEFSALDYTAPEQNHYSYRLVGFDEDWIASQPTRRLATYTNLPPGDYRLQLRGSDHEAPWTPVMRDVPVRVLPSWYQTVWFRLAAAALVVLALIALLQLRTAFLRQRQRELRGLVAQRTMELERRSAELQQLSVELRESKRQLERIAYVDPLTGISNRRLFDMDMTHLTALARRGGGDFTLLLIDLDRFKDINDTLGHDAGDALLIEATRRLGMELRESDRIFRLGGDEFAALLMATSDTAGIEVVCQRLLQNLARPFAYRDRTVRPSASIGAAQWSADTPGPDALYKCADLALYEAKNAGRNTWRWHAVPAPTEPIANS